MVLSKMKYFITGGAGFIGSHLVDRLIKKGEVTVYDNLSSGKKEFLREHLANPSFRFISGDLLNQDLIKQALRGQDFVFHLAANPDIRRSIVYPETDLKQGTIVTFNLLEAMRHNEVKYIAFASSSVVYGEAKILPTPEDYGPLLPISIYGASKLACEGLISAYCHNFGMKSWIFRFANVVGPRSTHGVIFDFLEKLKINPHRLEILGDGNQQKSYILVDECVEGILYGVEKSQEMINLFNLGSGDNIEVKEIARILIEEAHFKGVEVVFTGGVRGWKGDVPRMMLDVREVNRLGWKARYSSREAICQAVKLLLEERNVF